MNNQTKYVIHIPIHKRTPSDAQALSLCSQTFGPPKKKAHQAMIVSVGEGFFQSGGIQHNAFPWIAFGDYGSWAHVSHQIWVDEG